MKLRNLKLKNFLVYLGVGCLYPIFAYVSAEQNPLLPCINSMTIIGIVYIVMGVVVNLILHGDFDIAEYVSRRTLSKGKIKPFEAFMADKKEKREGQCNYPLFTGNVMLILSAVIAQLIY